MVAPGRDRDEDASQQQEKKGKGCPRKTESEPVRNVGDAERKRRKVITPSFRAFAVSFVADPPLPFVRALRASPSLSPWLPGSSELNSGFH